MSFAPCELSTARLMFPSTFTHCESRLIVRPTTSGRTLDRSPRDISIIPRWEIQRQSEKTLVQSVRQLRPVTPSCSSLTTSDQSSYNTYQSGGSLTDPTSVPAAYSNDPESSAYATGSGGINEGAYLNGGGGGVESDRANAWESRFGWRIDVMAAVAYLGGPITGERIQFVLISVNFQLKRCSVAVPHLGNAERLCAIPRYVEVSRVQSYELIDSLPICIVNFTLARHHPPLQLVDTLPTLLARPYNPRLGRSHSLHGLQSVEGCARGVESVLAALYWGDCREVGQRRIDGVKRNPRLGLPHEQGVSSC